MKNMKEFLVPTITLCAICLVAALLLAFTNQVTEPRIAEIAAQAQEAAKAEVMPSAASFGETFTDEATGCDYSAALSDSGETIGYAVTSTGKGGYSGDITLMVGIDAEGKVVELSFLEINETPSIGMKLTGNAEWLAQFSGLNGHAVLGDNVDAVSGATKTSQGITDAVNNALKCYDSISKEVGANG